MQSFWTASAREASRDHGGGKRRADHARRRLKLIRMAIATAHARTQATTAMGRPEAKTKVHAAKAQQTNERSFQAAPPGPVSARAKAIGARRMGKEPENKKTVIKRAIHLLTAPGSTALSNLAADLQGIHVLMISFEPQQPDNHHHSEHHQPK